MPCTTILVGKKASNDNSTMISRTDDGFFDEKKSLLSIPTNSRENISLLSLMSR